MLRIGALAGLALTASMGFAGALMPKSDDGKIDEQGRLRRNAAVFTENKGQWNPEVQFHGRGPGMDFWVTEKGLSFSHYGLRKEDTVSGHAVRMRFLGAAPLEAKGQGAVVGTVDILDRDGTARQSGIRRYQETLAKGLYPGVDLKLYYHQLHPRYDFIVAPNADPGKIRFALDGALSVRVDSGDLVYKTSVGEQRQAGLLAYQRIDGQEVPVPAEFKVEGKTVRFALGKYDKSKPLIIDPLIYGSYYGGDGHFDMVRAVGSDAEGGAYFTGGTRASAFPANFGPFTFNLRGGWDAFVTKFQGDAYFHDYAILIPGVNDEWGDKIAVDPAGNVWVAGFTNSVDFPRNTKPNVVYLRVGGFYGGGHEVNGGEYRLGYANIFTDNLPWNATAAEVQTALDALPPLTGKVTVTGDAPNESPDGLRIELTPDLTGTIQVRDTRIIQGNNVLLEGLQPHFHVASFGDDHLLRSIGSKYPFMQFTLTYDGQTTVPLAANASAGAVDAALEALTSVGAGNCETSGGTLFNDPIQITMTGDAAGGGPITVTEIGNPIDSFYVVHRPKDLWVMRFGRQVSPPLSPFVNGVAQVAFLYGEGSEDMSGFAISPIPGNSVRLYVAGTTNKRLDAMTASFDGVGFLAAMTYTNGTFAVDQTVSRYILARNNASATVKGVAVDSEGSIFLAGTLFASGNSDTASAATPVFDTTQGVWAEGRLQRGSDLWVRKYSSSGALVYSTLVGGNAGEQAAGDVPTGTLSTDYLEEYETGGSTIAVDAQGNAFITGLSTSFNYPRTRGVFGETFTGGNSHVVVTKLNRDASQLIYSTNLRTSGGIVPPMGIAVDARGQAYVTGIVRTSQTIVGTVPDPATFNLDITRGSVPTTPDALRATSESPTQPQLQTADGYLLVLNSSGTDLVYGSYIGALLDEMVYAPYTDAFGDVWVVGWTDNYRYYQLISSTGAITEVETSGASLPTGFISPLAYKASLDPSVRPNPRTRFLYDVGIEPFVITPQISRDGFILKFRLGLPVLTNFTLNPLTIAGGDPTGGSNNPGVDAVVTLSDPAPAGGVTLNLSLDNGAAASFSQVQTQTTASLAIPAGANTGTFRIYSRSVLDTTEVNITADLEGNFLVRKLTIKPWLQQLSVSPNSVVGGNSSVGRVRLLQNAPTGGVVVGLATDGSGLASVPSSVTVPEGQDTATFTITTTGTNTAREVPINASLLGVGLSQSLRISQASLITMTFSPDRVAAQNSTVGKVTLDGAAGSSFRVILSHNGGQGYRFDRNYIDFQPGDRERTFTFFTGPESSTVTRRVTASRAAQNGYPASTISGTVFVDAFSVTGLSLNPTSVNAGGGSTGRVTINAPAPTGGVRVFLSSTVASVKVPTAVMVAAGATSANFKITTEASPNPVAAIIRAYRGQLGTPSYSFRTAQLKVLPLRLTLALNPSELVGGLANSTATVTLSGNAPSGGLALQLSSSNTAAATVPATVTVPAGQRTATFTVTTNAVNGNTTSTIRAQAGPANAASSVLRVLTFGVAGVAFSPSTVIGGNNTQFTVTLEAPAPAGGATVQLNKGTNGQIVNLPTTISVPAGSRTATITVSTNQVSRTLRTQVTALFRNKTVSTVLTVNPKTP